MRFILVLAALTLTACSSGPATKSPMIEHFETEITDNGSKLFVYEAIAAAPSEGREQARGGRGRRGEGGGRASRGGRGGQDRSSPDDDGTIKALERIKAMLDNKLAETGYCREGYMSLEESVGRGQAVVRGECTETATDEDITTFGSPVTSLKQRIN